MNKIIEEDIRKIIESHLINWEKFQNKTVLVSGANGMLPSYMVYALLFLNRLKSYNIHVIALVRNKEKGEKAFKDFSNKDGLDFIIQDVSDKINYDGHIDFIIHAASQAAPSYYGKDPVGRLMSQAL